ncbi:L,D-transpeptidase family protein [Chelatococcus sp. GCM10030263]|uniref:L,D-transpeptidase family protein n=1 Tax=Chelatococcus sp. GCM10030263 TaxID=3273387 RepID=UPI00361F0C89
MRTVVVRSAFLSLGIALTFPAVALAAGLPSDLPGPADKLSPTTVEMAPATTGSISDLRPSVDGKLDELGKASGDADPAETAPNAEAAPGKTPGEASSPTSTDEQGTGDKQGTREAAPGDAVAKTPPTEADKEAAPSAATKEAAPSKDEGAAPATAAAAQPSTPPAAPADGFPQIAVPDVVVSFPAAPPKTGIATYLESHDVPRSARLDKAEREAIAAFYAERAFMPLWLTGDQWTAGARRVIATLEQADDEGLYSSDYPIPIIDVLPKADRAEALAEADIKLSALAVTYARDARGGRLNPRRVSSLLAPTLDQPSADTVLRLLSQAADPGTALEGYNPQQAAYKALKTKLAEVRAARPTAPMVRVPNGPVLKVGMRDPRVPLVRARFGLDSGDSTYDEQVAAAVASFQKEQGLPASGVLNRQTVAALAPAHKDLPDERAIIVNMEKWRWLPADLGDRYLMVNIPAYTLSLIQDGKVEHSARVVVGKPQTPTPVFSHVMQHVIVNPYWTVPPSIIRKEFLPAMAKDPGYAERRGYEVIRRGKRIIIRQPPGDRNALGHIKFMFPNDYAVYLHDTPSRNLFKTERRAYSHGCVRVDNPFRLAELVLGADTGWTEAKVKKLVGRGERLIKLAHPLPIHLVYFTLSVDEDGKVTSRDDIYGFDRRLMQALGLTG